jgi:hypothetical protein
VAEAKIKKLYNRSTGVHVEVSEEVFKGMNASEWAPSSDATRKATRDAAMSAPAPAAAAADASTSKSK